MKAKASLDDLIAAHRDLKSIQKVAERFGMSPASVHERLAKAEYDEWRNRRWTKSDNDRLIANYDKFAGHAGGMKALAAMLGRTEASLTNRAKRLGLQDRHRPIPAIRGPNEAAKKRIAENGHPRGMAGKSHTAAAKEKMSAAGKSRWSNMSESDKDEWSGRQLAGRIKADTDKDWSASDGKKTWRSGWREIGGQRKYFRSLWEANYARYLQFLIEHGEILAWQHEPKTFWFDGIRRGVCSYKPDFLVTDKRGREAWHEVKGWMDDRSRVALARFAKFYPDEEMILVDGKAYRAIAQKVAPFIADWE